MSAVLKLSSEMSHTGHKLIAGAVDAVAADAFDSILPGLSMSRCSMFTCNSKSVEVSNVREQIGHANAFNVSTYELGDEFTDGLSGSKCKRFICSSKTTALSDVYGQIGH